MRVRNIIAFVLTIVSFVILVPSLMIPSVTISASVEWFGQQQEIFRETRSIIRIIRSLHESGNDFVAGLILLFSVIVPFVKGVLLAFVAIVKDPVRRYRVYRFVRDISKWAMADVFVVGVYVAFLSAKATDNLDAELHIGFYLFAAYCLVALVALQFMAVDPPDERASS
jgi:paraquat-inducible protein A